jgi:aromatic-L-amino-acid/L-tryptophan decarboxylase
MAPHPLSLVCFRLRGPDAVNRQLLEAVNATGRIYLSHTKVRGAYTLRMAIGAISTRDRHIADAWDLLCREATRLQTG